MDRERKLDRRHNHGSDQRAILNEAKSSANTSSNSRQAQNQAKQTSKSSNSKFNRILGNLERSILSQFNHSEKSHNDSETKQKKATSAERKQIIHLSQQQPTPNDPASKTDLIVENQQAASHQQHRIHDDTARRHHLVSKDKVTSSLKGSVVKSASEKLGKLTLNTKCQLQESPRQPSSLCSNLATSRLSIPPPHANDEARSLNQTLLFGNGAIPAALDTSKQHQHQMSPETTSASTSSATMRNNLNCGQGQRNDRLFMQQQHANRPNSSPAISAKSLPVIAPKPGSHLLGLDDNKPIPITSQEEDEESGFATYQSRRAILQNSQQRQQQLPSNDSKGSGEKMIFGRMNQFPSLYPNNQTMNQQVLTSHPNQNNMVMLSNNPQHNRYNHMIISSNQVPIISMRDSNPNDVHYNGYSNNQRVPQLHNGFIPSQNPERASSYQAQQANFIENHHKQLQVQRMMERQQSADYGQQIYANAPPKPRRYQYYDGAVPAPVSRLTSQPSMTMNQTMTHQPNATMNSQMTTMTIMQRPPGHPLRPLANQQAVFNNQGQPQVSHPLMIGGSQSINNASTSGMPNTKSISQYNYESLVHPQPQFQSHDQITTQQPMNFSMMKSKSSLDAGDVMRFKHNKQIQGQHIYQQQQPLYGYLQNEMSSDQAMNTQQMQPIGYNQNLRPQPFNDPLSGNLQRSKSVTHLLPESNEDNRNRLARVNYQDQIPSNGHRYLSTVSSVSTNHLNNIGINHLAPLMTHTRSNRGNELNVTQPTMSVGMGAERMQPSHQHKAPVLIPNNGFAANQFYRARSMAALNNDLTISNKTTRQAPGNHNVSQEGGSSRKPSLDDQIKHLLIGGVDNPIVSRPSRTDQGMSMNNRDNIVNHQAFDVNDRSHANRAPCSSSALMTPQALATVATPAAWTRSTNVDQVRYTQQEVPHAIASKVYPCQSNERGSQPDQVDANLHVGNSVQNQLSSTSNLLPSDLSVDMGNRQQRRYRPNQDIDVSNQKNSPQNSRRQADANSHLIVDLTTPRVLAKTQTTLLPSGSKATESWSINQVGLPQMSSPAELTSTSHTEVNNVNVPQLLSSNNSSSVAAKQQDDKQPNHTGDGKQGGDCVSDKNPSLERSAPYYYSDLKSKEQREALKSIVQQKSLSPPPQLLSRSTDQSGTRLALRSATLHSGHARTLSDNLAQRQRTRNDLIDSRSSNNLMHQSHLIDSSSTSNIAKNIDKLFERPPENQKSMTTPSAQSMLTLTDNKESHGLSNPSLKQESGVTNGELVGFSGNQLKLKNISKSKSLDNISQKSFQEEGLLSKCSVNPIYENIRCSNKLLNAINDTTVGFSTSSANTSANMKVLATVNANSDESMDSILGSSLDDSDSCSDLIDEIKISSTDNHLNDISDLIEQLKINQSKMADEYKSTLVRIAKTINSKQEEKKDSDKLARRLQLLEMKSRKCEARSKNQLALIQMMEKVLRQSRVRALSNRLPYEPQQLSTLCIESSVSPPSLKSSEPTVTTPTNSQQLSSLESQHETKLSTACIDLTNIQSGTIARSGKPREHEHSDANDKQKVQTCGSQEIIKAIVVEKETNSAVRSKATVDRCESQTRNNCEPLSSEKIDDRSSRSVKMNAVAKRILDIEARNKVESARNKNKTNPFCNNSTDDSDSSSGHRQGTNENQRTKQNNSDDDDGDDDASLHDDEDFIEFLSNDNSSHRSQFEASQFSASDFNTSTATSESSTSSGAINDSLNSLSSARKMSPIKDSTSQEKNSPVTVSILKNRRCSYDDSSSNGNGDRNSVATKNSNDRTTRSSAGGEVVNEKFKNVLGNVVDVDICPSNNLSQGSSPVNNQPQTLCLN